MKQIKVITMGNILRGWENNDVCVFRSMIFSSNEGIKFVYVK